MGLFKKLIQVGLEAQKLANESFANDDGDFYCESCGEEMDIEYNADAKIVYLTCPNCSGRAVIMDNKYYFDNPDEEEDAEEGFEPWHHPLLDRPKVCTGCGSDMYPDCQESCKYFDD